MLVEKISKLIGEAMKARDMVRLSTLRMLSSEFNYAKIEKQHDLSEEEELAVIQKEVKKRRESIEAYGKAKRTDLVDSETAELEILKEFLPEQMGDEELEKIILEAIAQTGASTMAEMGKVIGIVMQKTKGAADGGKVSMRVRAILSNG